METVQIIPLTGLRPSLAKRLLEAQIEAARCWNFVVGLHKTARDARNKWPNRDDLQKATKGQFALHSQTVQMICHQLLANVETTRQLRGTGFRKARYPYKEKRFFPLYWPAQAVSREGSRVVLPMGRGRKSLVFKVDRPATAGAVKICWRAGVYELHVVLGLVVEAPPAEMPNTAAIDLGEIHQATVATSTGAALVVSGRGIRSLKRQRHKALGKIARKRSRCAKGSRRYLKLSRAMKTAGQQIDRRIRDLRHKGTRAAVEFCKTHGVGRIVIGDPDGVRNRKSGRRHNQRMSGWEYGRDIRYLEHKSELAGMACFTGDERGTSSRCPSCQCRRKVKGRVWSCPACGFVGHRDIVGATNIHGLHLGPIAFPHQITYRRPGSLRSAATGSAGLDTRQMASAPERRSRPVTGPSPLETVAVHRTSVPQHPDIRSPQGDAKAAA